MGFFIRNIIMKEINPEVLNSLGRWVLEKCSIYNPLQWSYEQSV